MSFTQVAVVASLLFGAFVSATSGKNCNSPSVLEYFTNIDGLEEDLSKLQWGHAINTKTLLEKALHDNALHMIESDLIDKEEMVYMGHSTSEISGYSFEDFLKDFIDYLKNAHYKKGLKLDFKSTKAFDLAMDILEDNKDKITFPLWINADIVVGPAGPKANVTLNFINHEKILECSDLSIGWTTGELSSGSKEYTQEMINQMVTEKKTFGTTAKITYPVRAVYVAKSWQRLNQLLHDTEDTLTIWSPEDDYKDIEFADLKTVLEENKKKIFVDLPKCIKDKLDGKETQCTTTTSTVSPTPTTDNDSTTEAPSGTNIVIPINILFMLSYTLAMFV